MAASKIAISIEESVLKRLDHLVKTSIFPSRSKAIQQAVEEKLIRLDRSRLAQECSKLDSKYEQQIAEEGMGMELDEWPEY